MLTFIRDNITYKLGRNAKENFALIDDAQDENPESWWFHLHDYPSGHCIIYSDEISAQMVEIAASIVKEYSKLKDNKKVKIVYTQIKNVLKTRTIGQVLLQGTTKKISI
jgi:predicted ribosome quality control (RQC) complex YloA/Tae2 family protein